MNFDFGELKNDVNFVSKVDAVTGAVAKIEKAIKDAAEVKTEDLSTEEKVKHDLFLTYAVNSLYWMYLKINGVNPSTVSHVLLPHKAGITISFFQHGIKHELSRIKDAMERQKQIHDHKTIRPVLKQDAAKRMVRGGLYDFQKKNEEFRKRRQSPNQHQRQETRIHIHSNPNPQNRKRKFNDD